MQRNSTMILYGPEGTHWALVAPGGCPEGGTTHQGDRRARRALVGCALSGHPQVLLWPIGGLLVHKKSTKSFAVFGLRLILISRV